MINDAFGTPEVSSDPPAPKLTMAGPVWNHHAELNCTPFSLALSDKQSFLQWKKNKGDTEKDL